VSAPYWYRSSPGRIPGANVERAIERATEAVGGIKRDIDAFFETAYAPFIEQLELPSLNDMFRKE
jgi:hypothetical protein